jgi:hypothetical protein
MLKFAEKSFRMQSLLNRIRKLYTRKTDSLNPSVAKEAGNYAKGPALAVDP